MIIRSFMRMLISQDREEPFSMRWLRIKVFDTAVILNRHYSNIKTYEPALSLTHNARRLLPKALLITSHVQNSANVLDTSSRHRVVCNTEVPTVLLTLEVRCRSASEYALCLGRCMMTRERHGRRVMVTETPMYN